MKKVNINVKELQVFDLSNNCIRYEDLWDDVFGAEQWTEDVGDSVGYVDHIPVNSSVSENWMSFSPFYNTIFEQKNRENLLIVARNVFRSIQFCIERIVRGSMEPTGDFTFLCDEEVSCFEDKDGIVVYIHIDYEKNNVNVFFYCK